MAAKQSPLKTAQELPSRRLPESNRCYGHSSPDTVRGWIYVVEGDGGNIKIGWSQSPEQRIAHLSRTRHEDLHLWALIPGTRADERRFHERWSHRNISGEWFRWSDDLVSYFVDLMESA